MHMLATRSGYDKNRFEFALLLLERGADPFATDDEGETALDVARRWGNLSITRAYKQKGLIESSEDWA